MPEHIVVGSTDTGVSPEAMRDGLMAKIRTMGPGELAQLYVAVFRPKAAAVQPKQGVVRHHMASRRG